jgi:hypothetical protein
MVRRAGRRSILCCHSLSSGIGYWEWGMGHWALGNHKSYPYSRVPLPFGNAFSERVRQFLDADGTSYKSGNPTTVATTEGTSATHCLPNGVPWEPVHRTGSPRLRVSLTFLISPISLILSSFTVIPDTEQ